MTQRNTDEFSKFQIQIKIKFQVHFKFKSNQIKFNSNSFFCDLIPTLLSTDRQFKETSVRFIDSKAETVCQKKSCLWLDLNSCLSGVRLKFFPRSFFKEEKLFCYNYGH